MLQIVHLKKGFEYFRTQKNGKEYYIPNADRHTPLLSSFLEEVSLHYNLHTLGLDYLWTYFLWTFHKYESLDLVVSHSLTPQICFTKKSFYAFKNRNTEYDFTLESSVVLAYVSKSKFRDRVFGKPSKVELNPNHFSFDKYMRSKYLNTDKGLGNCLSYNLSYDRSLKVCNDCKFKSDCKKVDRR